LISADPRANIF
jgi:uncharacterized protein YeaO (DUF488 family)